MLERGGGEVTRIEHKKDILAVLVSILSKDDDLMPDDIDPDGDDGKRWQAARDELVEEFDRRAR